MTSGREMLDLARMHIGERYAHVQVPKDNPNWKGPWDCSEFMSWLVFQDAIFLYGCLDDTVAPAVAKAFTGAWKTDSKTLGRRVSVNEAAGTVGGMVLRFPPTSDGMGHIVICDGQGGTVEAKGSQWGVTTDTVHERRWDTGVLIPGVNYDPPRAIVVRPPPKIIYRQGATRLDPDVVRDIQRALKTAGFDPGPIDGIYGPHTAAAAAAFQTVKGLVSDGEVGPQTAPVLGVNI